MAPPHENFQDAPATRTGPWRGRTTPPTPKGLIVLDGAPARQPPKPEPPVPFDDGQLAFVFEDPIEGAVEPIQKAPALPTPAGPFQPAEPIAPPPAKVHPTHGRRAERRTRATLGIAARGWVGFSPVPRFPERAGA